MVGVISVTPKINIDNREGLGLLWKIFIVISRKAIDRPKHI
jgi:hypothetical protein